MSEPGLAPERTRLAWRRTLLALTVVALLCLRLAVRDGIGAASLLTAAAAMLLWVGALVVTYRRARTVAASRSGAGVRGVGPKGWGAGKALPLYAAAAIGYAVLGAILVLAQLPR
jgi:hypothetical protein